MSEQQQPDKDMSPGIFSWNELMTKDPVGSANFYSELFGWTSEEMEMEPGMNYTFYKVGDRPAAGMFQIPPDTKGGSAMWMGYVTVPDLAAAVQKATTLGARVAKDITRLPMGSLAIISDPQGAIIGLWEFAKEQGRSDSHD